MQEFWKRDTQPVLGIFLPLPRHLIQRKNIGISRCFLVLELFTNSSWTDYRIGHCHSTAANLPSQGKGASCDPRKYSAVDIIGAWDSIITGSWNWDFPVHNGYSHIDKEYWSFSLGKLNHGKHLHPTPQLAMGTELTHRVPTTSVAPKGHISFYVTLTQCFSL